MERFFDTVWRGLLGGALFFFLLPFLLFLIGEMTSGDVVSYGRAVLRGVIRGSVYGLVALGLTLIYRTQRQVNFAQGNFVALGAVAALTVSVALGAGYWTSAAFSIGLVCVLAMLSGAVVRPLVRKPFLHMLMATLGIGMLIRVLTGELMPDQFYARALPSPFAGKKLIILSASIPFENMALVLLTAILCGGLFLIVRHSGWGRAMTMLWLQGVDGISGAWLRQTGLIAWGLAGGLGAAAGILLAPIAGLNGDMYLIVFKAIPAAVLGGFGSLRGALLGGLLIGAAETVAGLYVSDSAERMAAFVILLVVLVIRPYGLFGTSQTFRSVDGAALS